MNLIARTYHYLYVELYLMNIKRWGIDKDQNFRTNVALVFSLFMNIFTLLFICELMSLHVIEASMNISKNFILGVVAFFGLLQYIYFSYDERYKKILEIFDFEKKLKNPKYYYVGTIYGFGSAFMLILVVWISYILKN